MSTVCRFKVFKCGFGVNVAAFHFSPESLILSDSEFFAYPEHCPESFWFLALAPGLPRLMNNLNILIGTCARALTGLQLRRPRQAHTVVALHVGTRLVHTRPSLGGGAVFPSVDDAGEDWPEDEDKEKAELGAEWKARQTTLSKIPGCTCNGFPTFDEFLIKFPVDCLSCNLRMQRLGEATIRVLVIGSVANNLDVGCSHLVLMCALMNLESDGRFIQGGV
ncbi:hypothetical protein K438DRAFT_1781306 [Mycena galopus ATCC 62051]|nr:hypothetical protein K438DRAFT_1781306 [Mycena galopus ATCC 62051]